jgi:hypothetical protein
VKRIAEALVECGMYVEIKPIMDGRKLSFYIGYLDEHNGTRDYRKSDKIDPWADTLEGRQQADALEDFLDINHSLLWLESARPAEPGNNRKWRLDRIKWCFEQPHQMVL